MSSPKQSLYHQWLREGHSKQNLLRNWLEMGNTMTRDQVCRFFELANPSATVNSLRKSGVRVQATKVRLKSGKNTVAYSIGSKLSKRT